MTSNIFDARGKFCPLPDNERDALTPSQRAHYEAVADAASKCAAAEQLCGALEGRLVEQTAEIRSLETRLAQFPKPSRIDLVRQVLMQDGR